MRRLVAAALPSRALLALLEGKLRGAFAARAPASDEAESVRAAVLAEIDSSRDNN